MPDIEKGVEAPKYRTPANPLEQIPYSIILPT